MGIVLTVTISSQGASIVLK